MVENSVDPVPVLLALVPALPLLGCLITILQGKLLGARAHLPAVVTIAASAVCSLALLAGTAAEVHGPDGGSEHPSRPVASVHTLWQWVHVDDAIHGVDAVSGVDADAPEDAATRPFAIDVVLRIDPLTATMLSVITCVGLLVAIFSIGYMHGDPGYPRFFALVSAFVFSMTMLVSASNYLIVYVFWEAVGACSYLLIGFWFRKPEAAAAAKKAFLVNRVGDFGLAVAVFLLWMTYGTLDFHDIVSADGTIISGILGQTRLTNADGIVGGTVGTAICLLLLLAACGKSAQAPLHVWLPNAMEGPTPASALIHAATMVTAGVYLVARSAPLFVACPDALVVVSLVGGITALIAGLIATVQNDLKKVLAYSTISQLGYMFVSLGTGTLLGFTAAIFHLVTHAFFKALLFMGAGSVMHSMGGVIDMRRFGGLRQLMPITASTFLIGSLALAGVPPFAGFFSKDEILASLHARAWPGGHGDHAEETHAGADPLSSETLATSAATTIVGDARAPFAMASMKANAADGHDASDHANDAAHDEHADATTGSLNNPTTWKAIWWMALFTAGLTAFYTFRAVFMTFTGPLRVPEEAGHHAHESPPVMTYPLYILAAASAISGLWIFSTDALGSFLPATPSLWAPAVASTAVPHLFHWDIAMQGTLAAAIGIAIAAYGHYGRRSDEPQMERYLGSLGTVFANRFYFDELYVITVVRPLEMLSSIAAAFDSYVVDGLVDAIGHLPPSLAGVVRRLQSGLIQRYALAGVMGVLVIVASLVWSLKQ
jgi:NADH-quinone oxidoreductase subunit L